ncbi:MAG: cytochrome c [Pseudomonadota bacterium]|nr:cytochrome c [Pseudomonadota bacterium]
MNHQLTALLCGTVLAVGFSTSAMAAGDAEKGSSLAATCMGCHGIPSYTNVYPTYHVPKVGGQHADYIAAALKAYQSGERKHPTMQAQAASLSDQDMADIGAYFASFKAK